MPVLRIHETARALGVSTATLRRWKRQPGFPVARVGKRGGQPDLFDPAAIRAWRRQDSDGGAITVLAGRIPELVASAVWQSFTLADGPGKQRTAGLMAASWLLITDAILEACNAPPASTIPEAIERLRQISQQ